MSDAADTQAETAPIRIALSPEEPEAGCEFTLEAEIDPTAQPGAALLAILDAEGVEIARAELAPGEEGGFGIAPLTLTAPPVAGDHLWQARLLNLPAEAEDAPAEPLSQTIPLRVRAHPVSVVVWGLPSALSRGESFALNVGLKCPCGCDTSGWPFTLSDGQGRTIHEGRVGGTPWPGTEGLNFAELTLPAPEAEGVESWEVTSGEPDHPLSHAPGRAEVRLVTTAPPEVTITVVVTDAETGAPVPHAKVVAHPYRTLADETGIAELRVPKGRYTIQVSGRKYFASRTEGDIEEDVTITAELEIDREFTDADAWA